MAEQKKLLNRLAKLGVAPVRDRLPRLFLFYD